MRVLSFSTLFFILLSCSICSVISAMASWCFFLRLTRVASCWMWASSRSRRSLVTSASRFLFSSIWAEVAPEASPRRSPMFSSSRAKSDLWRSALARACLSASSSSSSSSTWAWFSHVLKLASQVGPLALGLGASLPLGLELLLELLDMGLVLLDALLDLGNQALLVIKLGEEDAGVLLLALDGGLELLLGPLLVGDGLLGDLQLTLNLPPLLLNVGTATLLLLQRGLQLIQGALKLALDLVEMSHLVLGGGQILSGLGRVLADVLLLLVQLVDHLVLVGNLVVQAAEGVVTVGLLLLDLLDGHLDIVNVLLHSGALLLQQLFLGQGILTGSLLGNEGILGVSQVNLQAGDGSSGLGLLVVVDG